MEGSCDTLSGIKEEMGALKKDREFYTVRGYQLLNAENRTLTSSMEDYLEMIYRTCQKDGYARINQLAEKLHVRPSSTTKVIQKLRDLGLVNYQKYGIIQLTREGVAVGEYLLRRHGIIEEFLRNLGIKETLLKDTEMIEHDVSLNAMKHLHLFNGFFAENPDVRERFHQYIHHYWDAIDFTYPSNP